jgi:hypothetical protein
MPEPTGKPKKQMAETLKFMLEDEELHSAFNKLAIELNSRNEVPQNSEAQGFELNIVNATWGSADSSSCRHFWMCWLKTTMQASDF